MFFSQSKNGRSTISQGNTFPSSNRSCSMSVIKWFGTTCRLIYRRVWLIFWRTVDSSQDLNLLRKKAYLAGSVPAKESEYDSKQIYYQRSREVKEYVLTRARGVCESCGNAAPFNKRNGLPYLESHHVLRRTDGGPDHPRFVAGLYPTCNREIHHGGNGEERNKKLIEYLKILEPESRGKKSLDWGTFALLL